jgi:shikimate dehydrogenase
VLGSSTDGPAVTSLVHPEGTRVLVLGAGGGAQAVATALGDAGAEAIAVAARDAERAHALAVRLRTIFPERDVCSETDWPPNGERAGLIVNATPVRDEVLVEPAAEHQVVDLAYRPDGKDTALVAAARKAGCTTVVDGLEVLLAQGAASFERWTGHEAPVPVMRAALSR